MKFPYEIPGPAYREPQVRDWIFRRFARSFQQMTNLPLGVRDELEARYGQVRPAPERLLTSEDRLTVKALFPGGYEAVAMQYPDRRTVCVSSQVGCGLGCVFCATGQMGFVRNLEPFEIVAQVLWAGEVFGARPTGVVFMGMGEPLANYEAVLSAIRSVHDEVGISARNVVVSTVGLVPEIRRLAAEPLPVTLALSLHAPDDELRSALIPMNRRYPIAECLAAAREFRSAHGRRVSIEYALVADLNDEPRHATMLAGLLKGTDMHVNLIALNPTSGFSTVGSSRAGAFAQELRGFGLNVTVRDTRGRDIEAACGQLAVRARPDDAVPAARRAGAGGRRGR